MRQQFKSCSLLLAPLCCSLGSLPAHAEEVTSWDNRGIVAANADNAISTTTFDWTLTAPSDVSIDSSELGEQDPAQVEDGSGEIGTAVSQEKALTFIVSPYVWVPNVSGDIGVGSNAGQFELDAGDLLDLFEFGGLIRGEVRHRSGWGVSVDYMFADLGAGVDILIGDVDADINASILEATLVRRVELESGALDFYGGIRRWDAEIEADITTPFFSTSLATGDRWVDPIIGARYQHELSARWKILGQADVGGFGASSDFTWNAALGASYQAWADTSFQLVYRVLNVDRTSGETGTPSEVDLGLTIQGPLLGFAYRF